MLPRYPHEFPDLTLFTTDRATSARDVKGWLWYIHVALRTDVANAQGWVVQIVVGMALRLTKPRYNYLTLVFAAMGRQLCERSIGEVNNDLMGSRGEENVGNGAFLVGRSS